MCKQMNKSVELNNVCEPLVVFWHVLARSEIQATVILCFLNCFVVAESVFICRYYSFALKPA